MYHQPFHLLRRHDSVAFIFLLFSQYRLLIHFECAIQNQHGRAIWTGRVIPIWENVGGVILLVLNEIGRAALLRDERDGNWMGCIGMVFVDTRFVDFSSQSLVRD